MTEQSTFTQCTNCIYSEKIVNMGDDYTFLNPHGDTVVRKYDRSVFICRYNPPLTGEWPQVSEDDWCGHGRSS